MEKRRRTMSGLGIGGNRPCGKGKKKQKSPPVHLEGVKAGPGPKNPGGPDH